jgi:hypothetical protein
VPESGTGAHAGTRRWKHARARENNSLLRLPNDAPGGYNFRCSSESEFSAIHFSSAIQTHSTIDTHRLSESPLGMAVVHLFYG